MTLAASRPAIGRRGLLALLSSLVGRGLPFLAFFVAAGALATGDLATVAAAIAVTSGVGAMCASAGLLPAVVAAKQAGPAAAAQGARWCYGLSGAVAAVAVAGWPVIARMFDLPEVTVADGVALALAVAFSPSATLGPVTLTALGRDGGAAVARVVRGTGFALALLVAAASEDVTAFLYVLAATDAAVAWFIARGVAATGAAQPAGVSRALPSSRLALVPPVTSFLVNAATLGVFSVLARTHGELSIAALAIAQRWELLLLFVPASVSPFLLAQLSRAHVAGHLSAEVRSLAAPYVAVVVGPALVVVALADALVGWTSPSHAHAAVAVRVAAVCAVLKAANSFTSQIALASGRWRQWVVSDLLLAGSLVLVSLPLVLALGESGLLAGAGFAYLLSALYLAVALGWARRVVRPGAAAVSNEVVAA